MNSYGDLALLSFHMRGAYDLASLQATRKTLLADLFHFLLEDELRDDQKLPTMPFPLQ